MQQRDQKIEMIKSGGDTHPNCTIHFIPDVPLEHFTGEDVPRCEPLANQLAIQLQAFIDKASDTKNHQAHLIAPRIGVFGGLGQGKTTVIHWALNIAEANIHKKFPWSGNNIFSASKHVEWFDTAHYNSNDLEHEFDRLLGGLRPSKLASVSICIFFVILIALIIYTFSDFDFNQFNPKLLFSLIGISGISAILAALLKPWSYWFRSGLRSMTIGHSVWWKQGWRLFCNNTKVLIIDNLDRASLAQQRAVLRALYKHRDELGYAVIIGFDETRLLDSDPDPESPRELLRKAVHIEARMPVRVLTDTLRLAWMALAEAGKLNPNLHALLTHGKTVAALARTLELLSSIQPVSPRAAKHIVNNVLFSITIVKKEGFSNIDDWRAALRLQALFTALPELRNYGNALRLALQNNKLYGLDELMLTITAKNKDIEWEKKQLLVNKIFNATRAYTPSDSDWSPWVVAWVTRALDIKIKHSLQTSNNQKIADIPDFETVNYLFDSLNRLILGYPRTELANLSSILPGLPREIDAEKLNVIEKKIANALLPLIGVLLLRIETGTNRKHLLSELWIATNEGLLDWALNHIDSSDFYAALAEWILLEEKPYPLSDQQLFDQWWHNLADTKLGISNRARLHLLSLLPSSSFHLAEILTYAAISNETSQSDLGPEYWLSNYGSDSFCMHTLKKRLYLIDNPIQQFLKNHSKAIQTIQRLWPPIKMESLNIALLTEHCIAWRSLGLMSNIQAAPLEYLLLKDEKFGDLLISESDKFLPVFTEFFGSPGSDNLSSAAWLKLLEIYLTINNTNSSNLSFKINRLRKLNTRFSPLWKKTSESQEELRVQCMIAVTFSTNKKVKMLFAQLADPITDQFRDVLKANIQFRATLLATSAWKPALERKMPGIHNEVIFANFLTKRWLQQFDHPANLFEEN